MTCAIHRGAAADGRRTSGALPSLVFSELFINGSSPQLPDGAEVPDSYVDILDLFKLSDVCHYISTGGYIVHRRITPTFHAIEALENIYSARK